MFRCEPSGNNGLSWPSTCTYLFSFAICFLVISCQVYGTAGHGRLIEPPSRASAWRYGFQTPPDYNDHELYCGGFTRQWKQNGGKCGECGDAWDLPQPRPHENGGQWGQGVIVRSYIPGSEMTIRVELTASHMGYFEFRLCPKANAKQSCLDENLLQLLGGSPSQHNPADLATRFYPRNGSRIYEIKAQLPDLLCNQCVLQWRYVAGNNWGMCDDGNGAVGCGPQEEFRSCSDIALTKDARIPMRPVRPTTRITTTPQSPKKDQVDHDVTPEPSSSMVFLIVLLLLLLVAGIGIALVYKFYPVKINAFKENLMRKLCKKKASSSIANLTHTKVFNPIISIDDIEKTKDSNNVSSPPPVPPPRTKRDSRAKEISTASVG